jgi:DNA-binding MarR family transcriptional regulator
MSKPSLSNIDHASETPVRYNLDSNWVFSVAVLADQVARRVANIVSEVSDLNLSHWRVLAAVADKAGRTASDVVDLTPMDKGVVSRAVKHLSDTGLVERHACASDGRLSYLFMTDEGYLTYERIVTALRARGATGETLPNGQALNDALKTMIASYGGASEGFVKR